MPTYSVVLHLWLRADALIMHTMIILPIEPWKLKFWDIHGSVRGFSKKSTAGNFPRRYWENRCLFHNHSITKFWKLDHWYFYFYLPSMKNMLIHNLCAGNPMSGNTQTKGNQKYVYCFKHFDEWCIKCIHTNIHTMMMFHDTFNFTGKC